MNAGNAKKIRKGEEKMMKKLMALVLALALICTAAISALAEEPLLGGWQVNAENPTEIPDEVRAALDKALTASWAAPSSLWPIWPARWFPE